MSYKGLTENLLQASLHSIRDEMSRVTAKKSMFKQCCHASQGKISQSV